MAVLPFFKTGLFVALAALSTTNSVVLAACPDGILPGSMDASSGCICSSGYAGSGAGGVCAPQAGLSTACPGEIVPNSSAITTSLAGMDLTTLNMTGTDTTVRFSFAMPMVAGRNYTQVSQAR